MTRLVKSSSRSSMHPRIIVPSLIVLLALIVSLSRGSVAEQSPGASYAELKSQAEKEFAAGSYARANALYKQAASLELSAADKRWVTFRIADTSWRSQAGTQTADST